MNIIEQITDVMASQVKAWHRTGSSYTVYPPVTNTDVDFLILLREDEREYLDQFLSNATVEWPGGYWTLCSKRTEEGQAIYNEDPNYSETWYALRRGNLNLIVTIDVAWYLRAIAATELCKVLNLRSKDDRIVVFRCVRDQTDEYDLSDVLV